ncbi:hypothetical protein [Woodsholea maritima]|uniref:hypothetical protein n=1 Tax=Woodsholea maritima TaxID=240237 RepID=UPI00036E4858|nr:hypothetical protein [Woodsholea maritima]
MPMDDVQSSELFALPTGRSSVYFRSFLAAINEQNQLVHKEQVTENGPFEDSFTTLSGATYHANTLQASITGEGYVAILAQGQSDNNLYYICESASAGTQRFNGPVNLGHPDGVTDFTSTVMLRGFTGLPNVFVTDATGSQSIWWKYANTYTIKKETVTVTPPGTDEPIEVTAEEQVPPAQAWSDWQEIPGSLAQLTAGNNADGRIILAGINGDQVPYINIQTQRDPLLKPEWQGWQDIAEGLSGFEQLVVAIDGFALVHIFARIGKCLYKKVQTQVNKDEFSPWVLFASFPDTLYTFTVGVNADNGLYVVAQVGSGAQSPLYGWHQNGANNVWSTPSVIAHVPGDGSLSLEPQADLTLNLYSYDQAGHSASFINQTQPDHWSPSWSALGSGLASIAVTHDITPNPAD